LKSGRYYDFGFWSLYSVFYSSGSLFCLSRLFKRKVEREENAKDRAKAEEIERAKEVSRRARGK